MLVTLRGERVNKVFEEFLEDVRKLALIRTQHHSISVIFLHCKIEFENLIENHYSE